MPGKKPGERPGEKPGASPVGKPGEEPGAESLPSQNAPWGFLNASPPPSERVPRNDSMPRPQCRNFQVAASPFEPSKSPVKPGPPCLNSPGGFWPSWNLQRRVDLGVLIAWAILRRPWPTSRRRRSSSSPVAYPVPSFAAVAPHSPTVDPAVYPAVRPAVGVHLGSDLGFDLGMPAGETG